MPRASAPSSSSAAPAAVGKKRSRAAPTVAESESRGARRAPGDTKKRKNVAAEERDEYDEGDDGGDAAMAPSSSAPAPAAKSKSGFSAALAKVLSRDVDAAQPVLSKRHTTLQKLQEKHEQEFAEAKKLRKQRKLARGAHNVDPRAMAPEFEKQLRKVATKGVVALFNAIAKHQKAVQDAEASVGAGARTTQRAKAVAGQQKSFLDLLRKESGAGQGEGAGAGAGAGAKGKAPAPAPRRAGAGGWAVTRDDFVTSKKRADDDAAEEEDEENGAGDILGGSSGDDEY
jgi:hypothetical protein